MSKSLEMIGSRSETEEPFIVFLIGMQNSIQSSPSQVCFYLRGRSNQIIHALARHVPDGIRGWAGDQLPAMVNIDSLLTASSIFETHLLIIPFLRLESLSRIGLLMLDSRLCCDTE